MQERNVLAIGGLDPSGCAGIAADLKTLMAWDAHGLAVVTTITAQNTIEVAGVYSVAAEVIRAQLEAIVSDIEIHAVKIGLLADSNILQLVSSLCASHGLTNIVVDPVLRSTTNFNFADEALLRGYNETLFRLADVITPNLDEASTLTGMRVNDVESMKEAAVRLHNTGAKNVVITGGHLQGNATDVLYDGSRHQVFEAARVENTKVRGLGCTFASILAAHLARNQPLDVAIPAAKKYIAGALADSPAIGHGRGPLRHEKKV